MITDIKTWKQHIINEEHLGNPLNEVEMLDSLINGNPDLHLEWIIDELPTNYTVHDINRVLKNAGLNKLCIKT